MIKRTLLFAGLVSILYSCVGPSPITRLDPETKNFTWNYGQKYIDKTQNHITLSLAFDKNMGETLIFDVEVTNNSNDSLLVSPETFSYKALNQYGTMLGKYAYAINPEKMLLKVDKDLAREEAHQTNQAIVDLVSTTTEAAATISSLDDSPQKKQQLYHDINYNRNRRAMSEYNTEQRIRSLNAERDFWENNVLQTTELAPGYYIKGKVYFKRNINAATYEFKFPIGNEVFILNYEQVLHKP